MDICICLAEFLHCSLETITTLIVNLLYPNTKLKVFFFFFFKERKKEKNTMLGIRRPGF